MLDTVGKIREVIEGLSDDTKVKIRDTWFGGTVDIDSVVHLNDELIITI